MKIRCVPISIGFEKPELDHELLKGVECADQTILFQLSISEYVLHRNPSSPFTIEKKYIIIVVNHEDRELVFKIPSNPNSRTSPSVKLGFKKPYLQIQPGMSMKLEKEGGKTLT